MVQAVKARNTGFEHIYRQPGILRSGQRVDVVVQISKTVTEALYRERRETGEGRRRSTGSEHAPQSAPNHLEVVAVCC